MPLPKTAGASTGWRKARGLPSPVQACGRRLLTELCPGAQGNAAPFRSSFGEEETLMTLVQTKSLNVKLFIRS